MTKYEKFKKQMVIIFKEVANFLTNLLVPVFSILTFAASLIPGVPIGVVEVMKKLEYIMFNAAGTADDIADYAEEKIKEKK